MNWGHKDRLLDDYEKKCLRIGLAFLEFWKQILWSDPWKQFIIMDVICKLAI